MFSFEMEKDEDLLDLLIFEDWNQDDSIKKIEVLRNWDFEYELSTIFKFKIKKLLENFQLNNNY